MSDYTHEKFKERLLKAVDDLADIVAKKNLAYGNSYEVVPQIIRILYPDGVKPEQIEDMLLIVRLFDKIKRIVTDNDPLGEDPWQDIAGYAVLKLATRVKLADKPIPQRDPRACSTECTGRCAGCNRD